MQDNLFLGTREVAISIPELSSHFTPPQGSEKLLQPRVKLSAFSIATLEYAKSSSIIRHLKADLSKFTILVESY